MARYDLRTLTLPDKLYKLIRLALKDLEIAEKRDECYINMTQYLVLDGQGGDRCTMCLAGSVMYMEDPVVQELCQPGRLHTLSPANYSGKVGCQLRFLSGLQFGHIKWAFGQVYQPVPKGFGDNMDITPYETDPAKYKATLNSWADKLEALDI